MKEAKQSMHVVQGVEYAANEAKNNQRFKVEAPIYLSDWFNGTEHLIKMGFTFEEIEQAIFESGTTLKDLTEEKAFEGNLPTYHKRMSIIAESKPAYFTRYATVKGHTYERRERVAGAWAIRVAAQYQSLKHEKVIRRLFENKFDWFDKFSWSIYDCSRDEYEIYMNVTGKEGKLFADNSGKSLYVPVKALVEGDWTIIEERMTSYWKWYYNTPDRKEHLEKEMNVLKTDAALMLKGCLS